MLEIRDLSVSYDGVSALRRVSLDVKEGETVSVLGPNGAGKTTLLNAISGLVHLDSSSSIRFLGAELAEQRPNEIVDSGIIQVPEGRQIFPELTVLENIEVGTVRRRDRKNVGKDISEMFDIFPELRGREAIRWDAVRREQQMLAIARALVASPKLLMIDEPSMGLALW